MTYLNSQKDIPSGAPKGDMSRHEVGSTTIYLEHSGGYRIVRDLADRADIEYDVYALDRKEAVDLAYLVREKLLEDLPDSTFMGCLVVDVEEISSPTYYPDSVSREHMYGGEVAVYIVAI
ncbi:hypothetical protein OG897_08485 [Streptomyces sp. NBC_00237]|uniref:hypothetical protein n=1 Tax=Streptomyces sp. NBC_00237 TaxID=2975687 RepID=UPI00224EFBFF|nr:hypothetical protein [Streptomyces sp. NBC_00237]MCX5201488.1 hypothetical protein [Streptomyces sp. NBC_00237]